MLRYDKMVQLLPGAISPTWCRTIASTVWLGCANCVPPAARSPRNWWMARSWCLVMKGGVGTAEINNGTCARFVEDGCWWFHQYWGKNQMEILIDIEHPSLDTHTHTHTHPPHVSSYFVVVPAFPSLYGDQDERQVLNEHSNMRWCSASHFMFTRTWGYKYVGGDCQELRGVVLTCCVTGKDLRYRQYIVEGSLEVKLPTVWTDEKQSRAEAERRGRLEERRSEEKE